MKKLVTTEHAVPGDLMTERVDKQGRARRRAAAGSTKQLEFLVAISEQLSESRTLGEVVDIVYDGVRSGLGYDRAGIYVLDHAAGTFEDLAGTDDTGNKIIPTDRQLDVAPESNIWSFPGLASTLHGVPYYTEDAVAECPPELLYMYDGAPTHNIMVPLKVGEKVTGMISVDNLTTGRPIYPEEIAQLLSLAAQVSRAVESARLRKSQRESDERYRIIFESANIGIATSDVEGLVLTANPAYQRLVGYDETELGGMRWQDFTHPEDLAMQAAMMDKLKAEEKSSVHFEKRYIRKDGSAVWGSVSVALLNCPTSDEVINVVTVEDISERKHAEATLAESEEHYRTVVEASMDGILVQSLEGNIQFANARAAQLLGYADALDMVGRPVFELVAPQDRARAVSEGRRLMATRGHAEAEYSLVRKDGTQFPAEIAGSSIEDDRGVPIARTEVFRDVSERRQAESALVSSETQFRSLFADSPQPMWVFDKQSLRFLEVNDAAIARYGYSHDEFLAMGIMDIRPQEDGIAQFGDLDESAANPGKSKELRHRLKSGNIIDAEVSAHDTTWGDRDAVLVLAQDVTGRKSYERQLQHHAVHDALTGLPNRILFVDRLAHALRAAVRDDSSIAVLLMDLKSFKEVNDTFGHETGDLALQYLADRIRDAIRESDTVARLGDDEFAFVLPGVDATTVEPVVDKLRAALEDPFESEGRRLHLSPVLGVAVATGGNPDAGELLRRADVAMYVAKRAGTDFAVYQEGDDRHGTEQPGLLADLHDAVRNGELSLQFQPMVDTRTGEIEGVEALARWAHPQHGMIPPSVFIEMAERTGLIKPLTLSVLDQALHQCRKWRDAGRNIDVAVNLSAQSLHDADLDNVVREGLERWDVPAGCLTLEITESAVMSNPERAMALLCRLRDLGVKLSIDDFGTGYSSLSYLKRLPVSEVKIDRSFVVDALVDASSVPIVRSIVELGHSLGLRVVAEGIEDEETMSLLQAIGCDLGQGYGLCRPASADDLEKWLASERALAAPPRTDALRILAVDDDLTYLKLVRTLLTSEGFDVFTATTAASALAAIQHTMPHLVLTDVNLSGMDGLELARQIRSNPEAQHVCIAALTGKPQPADERRARAVGCDSYAMKPDSTRNLLALVHHQLDVAYPKRNTA